MDEGTATWLIVGAERLAVDRGWNAPVTGDQAERLGPGDGPMRGP
jgi:hypothetical protein